MVGIKCGSHAAPASISLSGRLVTFRQNPHTFHDLKEALYAKCNAESGYVVAALKVAYATHDPITPVMAPIQIPRLLGAVKWLITAIIKQPPAIASNATMMSILPWMILGLPFLPLEAVIDLPPIQTHTATRTCRRIGQDELVAVPAAVVFRLLGQRLLDKVETADQREQTQPVVLAHLTTAYGNACSNALSSQRR